MLIKDPVPGISAAPHEDNLRYFIVQVEGPPDTPYAGPSFSHRLHHFLFHLVGSA